MDQTNQRAPSARSPDRAAVPPPETTEALIRRLLGIVADCLDDAEARGRNSAAPRIAYLEALIRRVLCNFIGDEVRWQEPPGALAKALRAGLGDE